MKVHRYRLYTIAITLLLFFTGFRRAEGDRQTGGNSPESPYRQQAITATGRSWSFSFEYNGLFYFRLLLEQKASTSHLLLDLNMNKEI